MTSIQNLNGTVIKDNETYLLEDNTFLNHLTVSKTTLHPEMQTRGHSHPGLEEVYIFHSGTGRIQIDNDFYQVESGSLFMIPDGAFHRVYNDSSSDDLVFIAIFEKYERDL
jgi:quercetin dioxygenase-like cupin family protein